MSVVKTGKMLVVLRPKLKLEENYNMLFHI